MRKRLHILIGGLFLCLASITSCSENMEEIDGQIDDGPTTRALSDTSFNNRTVTSNTFISGGNIFTQNVSVSNGATLTFYFERSITINAPFTVNSGSQLTLTY